MIWHLGNTFHADLSSNWGIDLEFIIPGKHPPNEGTLWVISAPSWLQWCGSSPTSDVLGTRVVSSQMLQLNFYSIITCPLFISYYFVANCCLKKNLHRDWNVNIPTQKNRLLREWGKVKISNRLQSFSNEEHWHFHSMVGLFVLTTREKESNTNIWLQISNIADY